MNRMNPKCDIDRGAAAVELAILLPLLLLILFGIIDFGRMLNAQITLTEAAREMARSESLHATTEERDARFGSVTSGLAGATWEPVKECPNDDGYAEAKTTYEFEFITPLGGIAQFFGGATSDDNVIMTGKGIMPC